jgi:hypothetical protein
MNWLPCAAPIDRDTGPGLLGLPLETINLASEIGPTSGESSCLVHFHEHE